MLSKSSVELFVPPPDVTSKDFGIGNFNISDIDELDGGGGGA